MGERPGVRRRVTPRAAGLQAAPGSQFPVGRLLVHARGLRARGQLVAGEHLLNQRGENGFVHRCEPHQTRCKRSSCASDMASRSTPGVASGGRTLCSQRRRISAARGSETARSRKPRSISASEGGSLLLRVARDSRNPHAAGLQAARGCHPPRQIRHACSDGVRGACEQAPNQRVKLLLRQHCKLQQAGVQPLQLTFGHRVEGRRSQRAPRREA